MVGSHNHKVGYLKKGVWYEPTGTRYLDSCSYNLPAKETHWILVPNPPNLGYRRGCGAASRLRINRYKNRQLPSFVVASFLKVAHTYAGIPTKFEIAANLEGEQCSLLLCGTIFPIPLGCSWTSYTRPAELISGASSMYMHSIYS